MNQAKKLVDLLKKKHLTIASVESLTGGLFAATLANVAGASKVFRGGLVTYQSNFKTSLLDIKKELIDKYGVVSKEIATLMVKKAAPILKTDIIVSFTGNAGPSKEPGGAPVGAVYTAILCKPNGNQIKNFYHVYHGDRNAIRTKVCDDAIKQILKLLAGRKY